MAARPSSRVVTFPGRLVGLEARRAPVYARLRDAVHALSESATRDNAGRYLAASLALELSRAEPGAAQCEDALPPAA